MYVAQLNLYVPDELADRLRNEAKLEGKSLSKHVVEKYLPCDPPKKVFDADFWAEFDRLGPLPDDFVAPSRESTYPEREISFDDIIA